MRYTDITTALPQLAYHVMNHGEEVGSRGGSRTMEVLHSHVVLEHPWRREVLTPGRKASLPAQIAETMWVLAGRSDVEWLAHYLPRAAEFSDDGKVWRGGYGPRIRRWQGYTDTDAVTVDQLRHVVDLLAADPLTRRAVIAIYDPAVDTQDGKDIPCNNWLHFTSRLGKLHLHVATRSNDLMWGWSGINAFEWSALQEIVAGLLGLQVGELHFSITSLHLYDRHWQKARDLASAVVLGGTATDSARFSGSAVHNYPTTPHHPIDALDELIQQWFIFEGSIRNGDPGIDRMIASFPEPMMQSWLRVIAWHWTGDMTWLDPLHGTRLHAAALASPKRVITEPQSDGSVVFKHPTPVDHFLDYVVRLHAEKHAVYGDSWKKRGEQISILANIARKIDRLGVAGAGDTAADTVIDLLVYLAKYRLWLAENQGAPWPLDSGRLSDHVWQVEALLRSQMRSPLRQSAESTANYLVGRFDFLQHLVDAGEPRYEVVDDMLQVAAVLARELWEKEQQPDFQNPYRNIEDES